MSVPNAQYFDNKKIHHINLDDKYLIDAKGNVYEIEKISEEIENRSIITSRKNAANRYYIKNRKVLATFNDLIKATYYNHDAIFENQMLWVYWQLRRCETMYISDVIFEKHMNFEWLKSQGVEVYGNDILNWEITKGKKKRKFKKKSYLVKRRLI